MPAQAEIRQARGEADEDHPQKTRLSLLQRLANVGLGRRDEESEARRSQARGSGPSMAPLPPLARAQTDSRPAVRVQRNRYRSMQSGRRRKVLGRPMAVQHLLRPPPQGDDHLDIPAFLRRQGELSFVYNSQARKSPGLDRLGLFVWCGAAPQAGQRKQLILND